MSPKHNYVECLSCSGRKKQDDYDPRTEMCRYCKNTRMVVDPKEILCNMCAGLMCPIGTYNHQVPHGLYEAKVQGGYESYHLLDMNEYVFNFCEKCLRELFIRCQIKPEVTYLTADYGRKYGWEEDQEAYEFRVWEDTGGRHEAYMNGRCNSAKNCPNKAAYTRLINEDFREDCACEEHKDHHHYSNSRLVKFIPNVLKPFL